MGPHTTTEMHECVIVWPTELCKTDSEIAALVGCSKRTVHEVLQLHHVYSIIRNPHAQPCGCHCSLATADLNYLSSLLDANPYLYLDELQSWLATDQAINVSISTIFCAVQS